MSMSRGMDKENEVHIYKGILLSHKKEQNNAVCSNMDGPRGSKCSKSDTERQISYNGIYTWNLIKKGTNEYIYKTGLMDIENKLMVTMDKGKEGYIARLGLTHIHYTHYI